MREIKFRAKARFSGTIGSDKWIYSSVMRLDAPTNRLNLGGLDCDLETLGQFTGLYDKNGKEIYEGDILKSAVLLSGEMVDNIVRWIDCGFIANGLIGKRESGNSEVIGNIHEKQS